MEEELHSTADSHPKEKRQTITGRNFLKDKTWPPWKDILLMEELSKARKGEGEYIFYTWKDKEMWVEITDAVNATLSRPEYKPYSTEQNHVPLFVTVGDVTKRVGFYKKASSKVYLPSRIVNDTLSKLVHTVFVGLGPPTLPRDATPRRSRNATQK